MTLCKRCKDIDPTSLWASNSPQIHQSSFLALTFSAEDCPGCDIILGCLPGPPVAGPPLPTLLDQPVATAPLKLVTVNRYKCATRVSDSPVKIDSCQTGVAQGLPPQNHLECHGNRYHIWSGDHARTFYVPHRSWGGARRPSSSSRVYLGQNLSDSRMITHLSRDIESLRLPSPTSVYLRPAFLHRFNLHTSSPSHSLA